jgi:hypothetical protein
MKNSEPLTKKSEERILDTFAPRNETSNLHSDSQIALAHQGLMMHANQ